ncbi:MAG: Hint domain-containing protein [Alphaproteobacteria bacterium]|nr:Hint domain-containing protein [Alphaproteobacteria bacterium]
MLACFAAGTRIATPAGARPVEALRPGDAVLTPRGPRRLRWAGRRRGDARGTSELRPVRITAGALGPGRPSRDLLLSPSHAVLLAGSLVPAIALLHGAAVRREPPGDVDYCHLALDTHDIVFAEGVAVETFMPGPAAPRFDEEWGRRPLPGPHHAPRLEGGTELEALRATLFGAPRASTTPGTLLGHVERIVRAGGTVRVAGWAHDPAAPAATVLLEVLRDGEPHGHVVANRWRPDLDRAGLGNGRCAFDATFAGTDTDLVLRRCVDGAVLPTAPGARR